MPYEIYKTHLLRPIDGQDPLYLSIKPLLLSAKNPYFARGPTFYGVGGPHVSPEDPWPMSLISAIYGSDDDDEIMGYLSTIMNVR